MSTPESVKTKICIHWEGDSRPFATFYDFNEFKNQAVKIDEKYETEIRTIWVEGKEHPVIKTEISALPEAFPEDERYGVEMALIGEPLPYNFRVKIFIKE